MLSCFKIIVFQSGHQLNLEIIMVITKMAKITFSTRYKVLPFAPIRGFVLCLEEDSGHCECTGGDMGDHKGEAED